MHSRMWLLRVSLLLAAFLYSFPAHSQGLVAYYPFNGNANDESGNANNGTVVGATLTVDRFGVSGKAYHFNGSSNYIGSGYQGIGGNAPRSFSFFFKMEMWDVTRNDRVLITYGPFFPSATIRIDFNADSTVNLDYWEGPMGPTGIKVMGTHIRAGEWHHLVVVLPDVPSLRFSDVLFYLDGDLMTESVYLAGC